MLRFSLALIACLPATIAGAVGSDDATPPKPTETTTVCEEGQVWNPETEVCDPIKDSRLGDDALYDAARELAYFARPDDAIAVLAMMDDQAAPRVLNYMGFAHRKAGRMAEAFRFYSAAIAADPDYALARSYMGMGYVSIGRRDLAQVQLAEIAARAGRESYAYMALAQALDAPTKFTY